jgi:TPR repeat protein
MPARMILALMLGMLVLPALPQDEPPPNAGDTSEVPIHITALMAKAEQGDAFSQYFLALYYELGLSVPPNDKEAFRWYLAAAEQGFNPAQRWLGFMYAEGRGVSQDYVQAHLWFGLAAASGGNEGDRALAAQNRDAVAEQMTAEQIAEAQRLAGEWKPKTESQ